MPLKNYKFLDSFPDHVFRYLDQTGEGRPPVSSDVRRDDLNKKMGYESYFTVNGFQGSPDAKKESCTSLNAFFVDIDDRKDEAELEFIKDKLCPTFILETGNGYHLYWVLDEPIYKEEVTAEEWQLAIARWERIEQSVVKILKGDPVVKDLTRIMRIPGTYYWKKSGDAYKGGVKNAPFKIKGLFKQPSATYSMDQVEEVFPTEAQQLVAPFPETAQGEKMQKYADAERKGFFDMVNKAYPIEDRPSFQKLISGEAGTLPPNIASRNMALLIVATQMRQAGWKKKDALEHIMKVGWHGIESERSGPQEIANTINSAFEGDYTYSYKNDVIAYNMSPEEQVKIQMAYTDVAKKKKDTDKVRFSNYEYEIVSRYPHLKKNEIGIVFNYYDGVYKMLSDQDLSGIVLNMLHEDMLWGYRTKRNVSDKVACLISIIPDLVLTPDKGDFFNVKNGLLQLSTGELKEHTPDFVTLIQSPVVFDPAATAPTWATCVQAWMEGSESEEKARLLQQFAGYLLTSSVAYAKALFIVGDGGNGKSTFIDTLAMVIGKQATSNIDLEGLYGQYGMKGLIGKRLNIIEEVSGNYYQSHKLKKLVSGEAMTIDVKFKDQLDFRPEAKFVFSVNTMPRVDDSSNATERRMAVVQFGNNFRDNPDMDLRFGEGTLAKELSGILNWMVAGFKDLQKERRFVTTREQEISLAEYREENSSVDGFIASCLDFDETKVSMTTKLYGEYKDFCMRDGRKYKSSVAFTKELKAYGRRTGKFIYIERTNGHNPGFFKGVDVASSWADVNFEDTTPRVDLNRVSHYPQDLDF